MDVNARIQAGILTVVVVFGALGNAVVIASICLKRSLLKSNHYYLILHLTCCDLSYLLLYIPDIYSTFNGSPWISTSSYLFCKTWWPIHTATFNAGIYFLVFISMIRYRAIVRPLFPTASRRTLMKGSALVYVLAIICAVPYVLVLKSDEKFGCNKVWPMETLNIAYTVFLAGIQYFFPLIFLFIIYYKIAKEILRRNNKIRLMVAQSGIQSKSKIENTKPLLVCLIIVVCFVVAGLPPQILCIVSVSRARAIQSNYLALFNVLYIFGTTVIIPFIYGVWDRRLYSSCHCRKKAR